VTDGSATNGTNGDRYIKMFGGLIGGGVMGLGSFFGLVETRIGSYEDRIVAIERRLDVQGDRMAPLSARVDMHLERIRKLETSPPVETSVKTEGRLQDINRRLEQLERLVERNRRGSP